MSLDGTLEQSNHALNTLLGLTSTWSESACFDELFGARGFCAWQDLDARLQDAGAVDFKGWFPHAQDGTMRFLRFHLRPMHDEDAHLIAYALTGLDLSHEANQHDKMEQLALQDILTGLYNRRFINARIDELVARQAESGESFAIMLLDLDQFKTLNDSLGHAVGDLALRHVAEALQAAVPIGEIVGRLGGDEFIVIIEDCAGREAMHTLAEEIRQTIARPLVVGARALRINASIGIGLFPDDGADFDALFTYADREMFRAKHRLAQHTIAPITEHKAVEAPAFMRDLISALTDPAQIVPHYQPIVDLNTGCITSAEALCRWAHPRLGLLNPTDFVPMAEHHDLIGALDVLMLHRVVEMCATHHHRALTGIRVYANVSAATVGQAGFCGTVLDLLRRYALPSAMIGLELTESMALAESEQGRENMLQLHEAGVSIALDDFGTGFSSLSLLKDLPVSRLKLDRSFVNGVDTDRRQLSLVAATASLSDALGAQLVIEGIETRAQWAAVRALGAHSGQGYHFGHPAPQSAFLDHVQKTMTVPFRLS